MCIGFYEDLNLCWLRETDFYEVFDKLDLLAESPQGDVILLHGEALGEKIRPLTLLWGIFLGNPQWLDINS